MSRLQTAIDQIAFARNYTLRLLDATRESDWFTMPGVTHIAWQVGHLAMGQYRLVFERVRGIRPEDEQLISADFLKLFLRDSVPSREAIYPSAAEIREVFDRVHEQVLAYLPRVDESELDRPVLTPHSLVKTRNRGPAVVRATRVRPRGADRLAAAAAGVCAGVVSS